MKRTRRTRAIWIGSATATLLLLVAPARAASVVVPVEAEGCGALDLAEIERVLALELSHLLEGADDVHLPKVHLTCSGADMRIRVDDPVTGKSLERTLPLPNEAKGRERTMALAISQLFLGSWLELLSPPPKDVPTPKTTAPPALSAAAHDAASGRVAPPAVALAAVLGVRRRDLGAPFSTFAPSLRVAFGEGLRFVVDVGLESGFAQRGALGVSVLSVAAGAGVGARRVLAGALAIEGSLLVGGRWARLDGRADDPAYETRGGAGGSLEVLLVGGPTLRLGPTRLGVELVAGRSFSTLRAHVDGAREVSFGGWFVGLGASIGLPLGGAS